MQGSLGCGPEPAWGPILLLGPEALMTLDVFLPLVMVAAVACWRQLRDGTVSPRPVAQAPPLAGVFGGLSAEGSEADEHA